MGPGKGPCCITSKNLSPVVKPFLARSKSSSVAKPPKISLVTADCLAGNGAVAAVLSKDPSYLVFANVSAPDTCFVFDNVEVGHGCSPLVCVNCSS